LVLAMGLPQVVRGQTVDASFVREVIETLVLPALQTPRRRIRTTLKPRKATSRNVHLLTISWSL
jgi:hypothetical protein